MSETKEMTAVEVLEWIKLASVEQMAKVFGKCLITSIICEEEADEIVEKIQSYEEEKEKVLKTEWVYVCRIIEVQENGFKKCVHEEDIANANILHSGLTIKMLAEGVLKNYFKEHDGNFFATVEHICRVK